MTPANSLPFIPQCHFPHRFTHLCFPKLHTREYRNWVYLFIVSKKIDQMIAVINLSLAWLASYLHLIAAPAHALAEALASNSNTSRSQQHGDLQ